MRAQRGCFVGGLRRQGEIRDYVVGDPSVLLLFFPPFFAGGYNFQGCWATGWTAGHSIARSILAEDDDGLEKVFSSDRTSTSGVPTGMDEGLRIPQSL